MANKKITELPTATTPTGTEVLEVVQSGLNKKLTAQEIADLALTDEQSRAFSEILVFDKNEIEVTQHTMSADINFVIDSTNSLSNESSSMIMEIVADGVHALNFISSVGATFAYIYPAGTQSGVILEAGTYEIYIYYLNGKARVNIPGVSSESSGLTQLSAPGNFLVSAGGTGELDLSWDDVANETEYQIERSETGTGGWTLYSNPAANATSDSETGLGDGVTIYYRIKAIGDGVTYSDSPYSTASGQTVDAGDVTAPVPTFNPANGNAVWTVNRPATITLNEAIIDSDGVTAITSANAADYVTLKQTNSGGADIAKTVTYDSVTRTFTITPTNGYGATQLVYLALSGIEDVTGNEMTLQAITFTTTNKTYHNGTSNRTEFGDILDTLFAVNDTNFWIEITTNNTLTSGGRHLVSKYTSIAGQRCFSLYYADTDIYFTFWGPGESSAARVIKWAGALDSSEHDWVLKYDGSVDTNNGLDRCILTKDGVTVGSKTLDYTAGALFGSLLNATSKLCVGSTLSAADAAGGFFTEELSDFKIKSANGTVTEIDVPVLFYEEDNSGNNRDGVWV
jgi:hypothetical protein